MALFEVQARVGGQKVSHVAEYESADAAREVNVKHLGPGDEITNIIALEGFYGDTRRLAAARLDQTADDGYSLL